ncbi:MAG: hypothetical protein KatS3mg118_2672 [Paracoccaceae bacterium]|nr:MAG: hypothetical protein KatS3mg118_2672 [Paracoccaceae bacterium]
MQAGLRHRIVNLAQSALLLGGMAVLAWIIVSAIAGPQTTLLVVGGAILGLMLAPGIPKEILLRAYGAERLTGRDFPEGRAILAELARRAGLPRVPALYYVPSRLPNAFALGSPEDSAICVTDGLLSLLDRRENSPGCWPTRSPTSPTATCGSWASPTCCRAAVSLASPGSDSCFLLLNLPLVLSRRGRTCPGRCR